MVLRKLKMCFINRPEEQEERVIMHVYTSSINERQKTKDGKVQIENKRH